MAGLLQQGNSIIPRARNGDALTSHEAAIKARSFALDHRACILGVLWRPMHVYDIAKLTGLTHVQVGKRMKELEELGKARTTGALAMGAGGVRCRLWERVPE